MTVKGILTIASLCFFAALAVPAMGQSYFVPVFDNPAMPVNPTVATATVGAADVKITSLLAFGGGEGARLFEVAFTTSDQFSQAFRNLALYFNGVQVGATISEPMSAYTYVWILNQISILPKEKATLDIRTDVLPTAPVGVELPTVTLQSVTGVGSIDYYEIKTYPIGGQLVKFVP